jgi:CBS domain-containing protein
MTTVKAVLDRKGATITAVAPTDTVLEAARRMNERRIGAVVVLDGEQLLGIFTERDVLMRVVAQERAPSETLVRDVMTAPVRTISPETDLQACEKLVTEHRIRHLPVVQDGRLVGVISAGDLLRNELEARDETIRDLQNYIQS